ncbi:4-hydroxybutyrate dehydrogenase [Lachnospiraceae bacterium OttesenSCG-928-E19]|nr:4-hydroxybutyrate dehydrogenase [Lachnospiraceae bacterium OttesenSCG-928-E19]
MKGFQEKTCIHLFENVKEFLGEFEIRGTDFILASRGSYERYFSQYVKEGHVAYKSDYGRGEPTDVMMNQLIEDFEQTGCNRVIAIGGGAVLDMAKVLVLKKNGTVTELFRREVPVEKERELIAIPTTCGSGSEVSGVSILELTEAKTKLGLVGEELYPEHAVLIPELLGSLSMEAFTASSIDALIHAMESYLSPRANVYTQMCSKEAIGMILEGFQDIIENGAEARSHRLSEFMIGSNLAGIAFANAGTGAVHALSYPLSGVYHVAHGEANYQFLTEVFSKYNALEPKGEIQKLNRFLGQILRCSEGEIYSSLSRMLDTLMPKKKLSEYGMEREEIEQFSQIVEQTQQRLLNQSYVKFSIEQMKEIYENLF